MSRRRSDAADARVDELVALGLTRYQAAAYSALHGLGAARPRQVAETAGVPLARAYEALDDLVRLELAERVPGRGKRYRALAAARAVDREVARLADDLATLDSDHRALLRELSPPTRPASAGAGFLASHGGRGFAATLRRALDGAEEATAVLSFATCRAAFGPALAAHPWTRLVVLAHPRDLPALASLRGSASDVRVLPERPDAVECLVAGPRLVVRIAGETSGLETENAAFVADGRARIEAYHARAVPLARALDEPDDPYASLRDASRASRTGPSDTIVRGEDAFLAACREALAGAEAVRIVAGEADAPLLQALAPAVEGRPTRLLLGPGAAVPGLRGASARTLARPPSAGGLLAGGASILWPLPAPATGRVAVVSRDPAVAANFADEFERAWAESAAVRGRLSRRDLLPRRRGRPSRAGGEA